MHETSRPRLVVTILFAIALLACDKETPFGGPTPFDGMTPIVNGTIVSRAPVDGSPAMLVSEDGATGNDCFPHRAWFTLGPDVMVFRNGARKGISDLKIGQRVSVFGEVLANTKPCFPPVRADGILLQ